MRLLDIYCYGESDALVNTFRRTEPWRVCVRDKSTIIVPVMPAPMPVSTLGITLVSPVPQVGATHGATLKNQPALAISYGWRTVMNSEDALELLEIDCTTLDVHLKENQGKDVKHRLVVVVDPKSNAVIDFDITSSGEPGTDEPEPLD